LSGKNTLDTKSAAPPTSENFQQLQRLLLDYLRLARQGNVLADQVDTSGPANFPEQKRHRCLTAH
jgi:hypothetical protein